MVALLAPAPNSSLMAGLRARLNNCCAIVSNIQPMLATLSTNQWYPVNSRHHAYFCPPAPSTVGDMKLLFYIVAATPSPAFSTAIWHASITTPREFSAFCGAMWGGRPGRPALWADLIRGGMLQPCFSLMPTHLDSSSCRSRQPSTAEIGRAHV